MTATTDISIPAIQPRTAAQRALLLPAPLWAVRTICVFALLMIAYFGWHLALAGIDIRNSLWTFSHPVHERGDVENAFRQGNDVLRDAEARDKKDLTLNPPHPVDPLAATIGHPGPMLFDGPMDWHSFHQRWLRLKPVYHQIYEGWRHRYDTLETKIPDANYDLDYPPLRLLVMTIWTWHVEAKYPAVRSLPYEPMWIFNSLTHRRARISEDLLQPLLNFNTVCEGIAALAMFFLVWTWVRRTAPTGPQIRSPASWRKRWGDPLLLVPVALLGLTMLLRPLIGWHVDYPLSKIHPIDERVISLAFWVFLVLRFLSAVCLARLIPHPFRGPVCGTVAATILWMNPAMLLDAHTWPQWDVWMLPFFLIAALMASINCWLIAGLFLGVGAMFKGQMFFVIPLFVFWPLLAGWPWRVMRILAGLGAATAIVVWPWLINATSEKYIIGVVIAAGLAFVPKAIWARTVHFSVRHISRAARWLGGKIRPAHASTEVVPTFAVDDHLSLKLGPIPRFAIRPYFWISMSILILVASFLVLWAKPGITLSMHLATLALLAGILLVPWFIPRRLIPAWIIFVFAAAAWLSAFGLNGDFVWWRVGFMYGTRKYQVMQLGANSLSNLSSILSFHYLWRLHDPMTAIHLNPLSLDLFQVLVIIYLQCFAITILAFKLLKKQFNTTAALAAALVPAGLFVFLNEYFDTQLFDHLFTLHMSILPNVFELDTRETLALIYFITLVLCTIGAAIHSRRNDPRILISLVAPWILFPTLLTQMTARYTTLPASLAAAMVGVSVGMSLWQLLLMVVSTCMLGNQLLQLDSSFSPLAYTLTHPTHPDMGWAMLLIAGAFLYGAAVPGKRSPATDLE